MLQEVIYVLLNKKYPIDLELTEAIT